MKWTNRFLDLAAHIAEWSKDPSTKVGCVIVGKDREILTTGFNGIPRGVADSPNRLERPTKYMWVCCAEQSAISQAARNGISLIGATAYTTHCPCSHCAKAIIQAGIKSVVFRNGATNTNKEEFVVSKTMFEEAKVSVQEIT